MGRFRFNRLAGHDGFVMVMVAASLMIGAGLVLAAVGYRLPVYRVAYGEAQEAFQAWCSAEGRRSDGLGDRYLSMFGWHYSLINAGISLVTTGLTIGAIALSLKDTARPDEVWFRTPNARWKFILLGVFGLAALFPGTIFGLETDLRRQYFPWCADSINIPIFALAVTLTFAIPACAIVGFLISLTFRQLPAPLTAWDRERPVRSYGLTFVFGAAILSVAVIWCLGIATSDITGPSTIIFAYLLASTRAALLVPKGGHKGGDTVGESVAVG